MTVRQTKPLSPEELARLRAQLATTTWIDSGLVARALDELESLRATGARPAGRPYCKGSGETGVRIGPAGPFTSTRQGAIPKHKEYPDG